MKKQTRCRMHWSMVVSKATFLFNFFLILSMTGQAQAVVVIDRVLPFAGPKEVRVDMVLF